MNQYPITPEQNGDEDRKLNPYAPVQNTLRTALVAKGVGGCCLVINRFATYINESEQ